MQLDDTELDVLSAVNSLHKMKDVWDYLRNEYGMSECDEGLDVLKDYLDHLLNKGVISEGTKTKPIYGEKGKKYPLYISVELTNRCNFKCSHCYKEAGSDNWDYIDENRIIPFLKEMINKIHGVTLTGGEATLHPAFSDIVQELPQNSIALLTNGSYLNKISDETLLRLGHIQISLYGCDEEEYVMATKANCFEKVIDGIRRVTKMGLSHDIAVILRPSNIDRLDKYMELLNECGVKRVRFGLNTDVGRNVYGEWSLNEEQCRGVAKTINEFRRLFPEIAIEDFKWEVDYGIPPLPVKDSYSMRCSGGKHTIIISEKGFVRPCHLLPSHCFQFITMEQYLEHIVKGEIISFELGINKCADYMKTLGKNLDSICPHGFI